MILLKKTLLTSLILILLTTLFGCESWHYSDEYITYNSMGDSYTIVTLTELGRKQDYIIIPAFVNGHKVEMAGVGLHNNNIGNVMKVFISYEINTWEYDAISVSDYGVKVFILSNYIGSPHNEYHHLYVSSWLYNNLNYGNQGEVVLEDNKLSYYNATWFFELVNVANVSYHYNYENSPNEGYYWIDDYNYGGKIFIIPPEPVREGYRFAGWYKEPECVNKWLFDTDVLPKIAYDENGDIIYNETELYAKWVS